MESHRVPPGRLAFDVDNPRLFDGTGDDTQDACAEALLDNHDPISIGRSLASFGFFETEPLIVLKPDSDGDPFVVLEGNRRLLAIRLLVDPDLRDRIGAMDEWNELAKTALSKGTITTDTELPVLSVSNRSEAVPQIGFRHIVGIKKWGALEKAAFLASLTKISHDAGASDAFEEVADQVSEGVSQVKRAVRDYRALLEMEAVVRRRLDDARADFGAFSRFMQAGGVRNFTGLQGLSDVTPAETKAFAGTDENIKTLVSLVYGSDGKPPVIEDTRHATSLGKILSSPEALAVLQRTRSLEKAEPYTDAVEKRLSKRVRAARSLLEGALEDIEALPPEKVPGIESEVQALIDVLRDVEDKLKSQGVATVEDDDNVE